MPTVEQLEHELTSLRQHGMRLWRRAEEWRIALERIRDESGDPRLAEIAKQALAFQHIN